MITVEESKTTETCLEVVEGMQFDRGYLSTYFVTDLDRMEAVLEDVLILIHEKKLSSLKDMLPFLERVVKSGRPLLIVAEDVDGEALATLVVNRLRGALRVAAVKSPGFGDRRRAMLEDMAILTGGRVLAEELGERLENLGVADLGCAQKVVIDKDSTTIIGGMGKKSELEARVKQKPSAPGPNPIECRSPGPLRPSACPEVSSPDRGRGWQADGPGRGCALSRCIHCRKRKACIPTTKRVVKKCLNALAHRLLIGRRPNGHKESAWPRSRMSLSPSTITTLPPRRCSSTSRTA